MVEFTITEWDKKYPIVELAAKTLYEAVKFTGEKDGASWVDKDGVYHPGRGEAPSEMRSKTILYRFNDALSRIRRGISGVVTVEFSGDFIMVTNDLHLPAALLVYQEESASENIMVPVAIHRGDKDELLAWIAEQVTTA